MVLANISECFTVFWAESNIWNLDLELCDGCFSLPLPGLLRPWLTTLSCEPEQIIILPLFALSEYFTTATRKKKNNTQHQSLVFHRWPITNRCDLKSLHVDCSFEFYLLCHAQSCFISQPWNTFLAMYHPFVCAGSFFFLQLALASWHFSNALHCSSLCLWSLLLHCHF